MEPKSVTPDNIKRSSYIENKENSATTFRRDYGE